MITRLREVIEGPQPQGIEEAIYWSMDVTEWGSGISNIVVKVYDTSDDSDVTATVTTGSPSESFGIITLPKIHSLTADKMYRVEIKFDTGAGNTLEGFFILIAE